MYGLLYVYLSRDGAGFRWGGKTRQKQIQPTRTIPIVEYDLRTIGFTDTDSCG